MKTVSKHSCNFCGNPTGPFITGASEKNPVFICQYCVQTASALFAQECAKATADKVDPVTKDC